MSAQRVLEEANFSASAYFNGYVYCAAVNDTLKAFQLSNGLLSRGPPHTLWISSRIEAGRLRFQAMATLMASGRCGTIIQRMGFSTPMTPATCRNEFYNTSQAGSRYSLGVATKFSIPLVANGKVFAGSQSQLVVYGLLP